MDSYRARVRFPLRGGLAAALLVGLAFFFLSGGVASAAEPEPPDVKSGSAQSNCQRIVDAGFSTDDYVLSGGKWQHRPDWTGADGARMSRVWGSVTICRGEYSLDLPVIRYQPTQTFYSPAPSNQGSGSSHTVSTVSTVTVVDTTPIVRDVPERTIPKREPVYEYQAQSQYSDGQTRLITFGQYAGRYERYYADWDGWDVLGRRCP